MFFETDPVSGVRFLYVKSYPSATLKRLILPHPGSKPERKTASGSVKKRRRNRHSIRFSANRIPSFFSFFRPQMLKSKTRATFFRFLHLYNIH